MELSGELFATEWLLSFAALYIFAVLKSLRWADWARLTRETQLNVFLGACVALMLLWTLRTEIQPGVSWHLSGLVSFTLMFGWSLTLVGASLVLLGITLAGLNDWSGFLPSVVLHILLPVTLTQVILALVRAYLPKHYFVYVFINAFVAAGVIAVLTALVTIGALFAAGAYSLNELGETYLLFLPLMFFPEAVLNGWIISVLVGYKPDWVCSFRDEEYLKDN
jgi:uncharacterized membrane protein